MFVHVVRGDQDVRVLPEYFTERLEFGARVCHAGRVRGAVEHEQACLVRDGSSELFRRDLELLGSTGTDVDRDTAREYRHVRVGDPVGRGNDDLVTRVENGLCQIVEALLAATGDENLVRGIFVTVVAFELVDNRLLELCRAVDRCVLGLAVVNGPDGGFLDVLGRIEIGLAGAKTDDVLAGSAQFCSAGRDCEGR